MSQHRNYTLLPADEPILSLASGTTEMRKSLIQQIKAEYPIANFVSRYTGGLNSSGRDFFIGRCPFHQEPGDHRCKFWVNTRYQICGCFVPRCKAYANYREDPRTRPLDVINFWALLQDISLKEAIEDLANQAGIEVKK